MGPNMRRKLNRHPLVSGAILFAVIIAETFSIASNSNIGSLLAAATSSVTTAPVVLYFTPYDGKDSLVVGQTADLDININARLPINAIGATIVFPQDDFDVVGINKSKSFLNLWTEDTVIKEGSGEVHFSGGTTMKGGMTGTSTVLTITVRAKKEGEAKLTVENVQVFANDGKGTSVDNDTRPFVYTIEENASSTPDEEGGGGAPQPHAPSADFSGDGKITIVDLSILIIKIVMPYEARYDLDMDGTVGLSDLSILLSLMK